MEGRVKYEFSALLLSILGIAAAMLLPVNDSVLLGIACGWSTFVGYRYGVKQGREER